MERESNGQGGSNSPKELPYRGSIPKSGVWTYELYMAGLLIATFLTDQATKTLVRENLVLGASIPADGFFRITHIYNTGSAFGLFPNQTFLLMIASLVGITILVLFFRNQPIPPFLNQSSLNQFPAPLKYPELCNFKIVLFWSYLITTFKIFRVKW